MINLDKLLQLRDGRPVRIYARDCGGDWPIHGAFQHKDKIWCQMKWGASGSFYREANPDSDYDLVNVPQKLTIDFWVNVYADKFGQGYVGKPSFTKEGCREDAISCIYNASPIARLHIQREVTEGEGL